MTSNFLDKKMCSRRCSKENVEVVILGGSRDFGRCPIASRLPVVLWPVMGKPSLERIIVGLAEQGIRDITVCCNGDSVPLLESIDVPQNAGLNIKFLNEPLPVGTAGSFRDAVNSEKDKLFVVFPASIVNPPDICALIAAHQDQSADLTVAFNPASENDETRGEAAGIYVCNPSVLEYIPAEGYYDIKESLIPELLRAGKRVCYTVLSRNVRNFRDWQGYLDAISDYLENAAQTDINLKTCERNDKSIVWKGSGVTVEPGAKIYGRVVLLDGVHIEEGVVIFGPTILGRNVKIGSGSVVVNSILWDNSQVGDNCEVQRSIVDYNAFVPSNSVVTENSVVFEPQGRLGSILSRVSRMADERVGKLKMRFQPRFEKANGRTPKSLPGQRTFIPWLAAGFIFFTFLWSYWPGIVDLWNIWQRSDEYSSGLLVPFLAVYLLWSRRAQLTGVQIKPSLWGIPAFVGAQAVRFFGLFFMFGSMERLSIVLSIAALMLLLFGWEFFRKVSSIMLFLFLMLPWPNRVQAAIALPLQQWATSSAVFCLEVIGYEVAREGNVIHIGQASVAVAEACNGLRMVTAFFVISGLVVLLVNRRWWEKLIVFVSSLPIALLCNTVRLAVTAVAFTVLEGEYWEKIFHDFGGYAMMPLALAIVVGELCFLARLTTAPEEDKAVVINRGKRLIEAANRADRRVDYE